MHQLQLNVGDNFETGRFLENESIFLYSLPSIFDIFITEILWGRHKMERMLNFDFIPLLFIYCCHPISDSRFSPKQQLTRITCLSSLSHSLFRIPLTAVCVHQESILPTNQHNLQSHRPKDGVLLHQHLFWKFLVYFRLQLLHSVPYLSTILPTSVKNYLHKSCFTLVPKMLVKFTSSCALCSCMRARSFQGQVTTPKQLSALCTSDLQ